MLWDLINEREIDSFDIDSDALYFQDSLGNPYILEKGHIIMCKQGCKIKSFKVKLEDFDTENLIFTFP